MAVFELESGGKTFEIEAPSMPAAMDAFKSYSTQQAPPPGPPASEILKDFWANPPAGGFTSTFLKPLVQGAGAFGDAAAGKLDPSNPEQRDAAIDAMAGLGALVPMAAAPGGALAAPAGALTSGMARRAALPAPANPVMGAAERLNVPIPKFLATDDMLTQRLAAGLKNVPGAGNQIVEATQGVTRGLGDAAKGIADHLGTGSAEVGGSAAKDALTSWMTEGSKKAASRVYDAVDNLVDPAFTRPLEATSQAVSEIMAKRANARIGGKSPAVDAVSEAISGPMNYTGLKDLRSFLGEMTPQEMVAKGISKKESERLYSALTDDLKATIHGGGGPKALSAFEKANSVFKTISDRRMQLNKIVGIKGDAAPEAVFSRLVSYAGSKSSADIDRLILARKTMGSEAWNEVASAAVAKLGRDPQGNFSPDRFFTAYGNISPNGRRALFGSTDKDVTKALDDINTVVNAYKSKITQFGNPSGTAQNLIGASMAGAVFSDPMHIVKALGGIMGGNALARALSQPATAPLVAEYVRAQSSGSPAAIQAAAQNLARAIGSPNLAAQLQSIATSRGDDQGEPAMRM